MRFPSIHRTVGNPVRSRYYTCQQHQHFTAQHVKFKTFLLFKDKKHSKNVGPIRHREPPHYHSPGVATVASHDNDNA